MRPFSSLFARSSALGVVLALTVSANAQAPAQPAPDPTPAPPAAAAGTPADKVVARVDGMTVTEADIAIASEDPALSLPGVAEAQKRDLLIGYMIDLKLGAKAAEAAKVAETAEFTRRVAYVRDKLMLDEYLEREVKKAVTPDAARKLYEETVKNLKPEAEVRARHILVEAEDEAKAILARIKGGEDFVKVAGEVSKDPGSKTDGGDLGFFAKDRMVEPFADAAFKLEPGQLSDPVKSQFGWHVIRLEEKRTKPVPAFEEMKEQVETYLTRKAQQDFVLALRQKAKIERLDAPKPAETAPAPAPAAPAETKKP